MKVLGQEIRNDRPSRGWKCFCETTELKYAQISPTFSSTTVVLPVSNYPSTVVLFHSLPS